MQISTPLNQNAIRIVQLTDPHVGDQDYRLLNLDTRESLRDVLRLIERDQAGAQFVVATGDIAGEPSAAAYDTFQQIMKEGVRLPWAWLPGNHDSVPLMEASGKPFVKTIELGSWLLVLLDSSIPGRTDGELGELELGLLTQAAKAHPDKHLLVCLHHQVVNVGSAWMDQYRISDHEPFLQVIQRFDNIRGVLWGHVHQAFDSDFEGVPLMASPSTCIQFKPNCHDFALDTLMPGYRWLDLLADGRIESGVERVEDKAYSIDFDSVGY